MAFSKIRMKILPGVQCLFDKMVRIQVEGLSPHKPVELRSRLVDDRGVVFRASARYKADEAGLVDLCYSPSLGGSYTGVDPMGLFWSLAPDTPHSKLFTRTVLSPAVVELEALHEETGEVLASGTNERAFMIEGMKRVVVQEGKIRGVLFIPPGKGPFPGIVDTYTFGGGLSEPRASMLAGHGFVVLALAYYRYQDLPRKPEYFELEYFEEAVTYLKARPEVKSSGIGLISISHSGGLALSMASFFPGISATVCINGCNGNTVIPLHYKDIVFPPLTPDVENLKFTDLGLMDIRDATPDTSLEEHRASVFPIERASANCHFLFAVSEDDRNWNSTFYAQQAAATLRLNGKESVEVVSYPKAGHFLEVPYMPFCPSGFHAAVGSAVIFGGEPKAHCKAQLDLWERVQTFFKTHLDHEDDS